MSKAPKVPPSAGDLERLIDQQLMAAIAGYEFLTTSTSTQALSGAVIVGITIMLGNIVASLRMLAKLRPVIKSILVCNAKRFDTWSRMRDDAAHLAGKLFEDRKPQHGRNYPWFGKGFRLLNYSPTSDFVATGSERAGRFKLGFAIKSAVQIAAACEVVLLLNEKREPIDDLRAQTLIRKAEKAKVDHLKREIAARVRV